ncbi:hypothetical protein ACJJTC_006211 [Scirpophaga incertulas]
MEDIKKYPPEYANSFTVCFKYFRGTFFTLESKVSLWRQYWPLTFVILVISIHFSTMMAGVVRVILNGSGLFRNANLLPSALIILQAALKYIFLVINRRDIKSALSEIGSNWRISDISPKLVDMRSRLLKTLTSRMSVFDISVEILFVIYIFGPLAESVFRRVVLHQDFMPLLPFECVYPFTITEWWTYLTIIAIQFCSMAFTVKMYLGTDMFFATICVHLKNEFLNLQEDLSSIQPNKRVNQADSESGDPVVALKAFIVRHQRILRLTRQISLAFSQIVFINLLFTAMTICFYAIAVRTSVGAYDSISNFGSMCIIMLITLVICYISETLSEASTGIADTAYQILWYETDKSYQTLICIIIMRSQKPCVLTALEYFEISLKTFTKVLSFRLHN